MHDRHVGMAVIEPLGIDPRLLPVIVEGAVRPLLEQVVLVLGRGADRGISLVPRHAPEPSANVLCCQRAFHRWVASIRESIAICPSGLLQIESAAVANTAAVGVGKAAAI